MMTLELNQNRISDRGATALAALINIKILDLSHNNIGSDGVTALTKDTSYFKVLDVSYNPIGEYGEEILKARFDGQLGLSVYIPSPETSSLRCFPCFK